MVATDRKRHITYPVVIVVDVKALVCVNEDVLIVFSLLRGRTHKSPHWQIIYEQLIPAHMHQKLLVWLRGAKAR